MNEAEIPIDIHTGKLQEWLVSRRITPRNFQIQIRDIRNKISNAIKDMPENEELIKLLSGAHINYFHCKSIVEILKQTEKDTKSVFGTYGSQRMKDWQEIIKLYEKENIYLGEAAQILVRNINYEIPGIKKQMAKFEQQSNACTKRIQDLNKSEQIIFNEHAALCTQLGIKGDNLKKELTEKLLKLPEIYSESISNIGTIKEALNLYGDFSSNKTCLPLLRHLIEFGNTTVYQYVRKEVPTKIEESPVNLKIAEEKKSSENDNEIDFGDDIITNITTSANQIDFGDNIELETGDIDWNENIEIISTSEVNEIETESNNYGIVVEGSGIDGGIAKGDQAYSILDAPQYRDKVIDELSELEAFLKLRHYELNLIESSSNILFSLMDNFSTYDCKSIDKMLKNVSLIILKIVSEQTQHLFQLKHSAKYANLLAGKLNQKLQAVEKSKISKELLKNKSIELNTQRVNLKPVLDDLIAQTKVLQHQIEKDISKRYKNRIVNLMGGINSL